MAEVIFSPEKRAGIREEILRRAREDRRISGGAITGSVAAGLEDAWSDIDLAFGVAEGYEVAVLLEDFSAWMYRRHGALHHLDVRAGEWIYRVFLLPGTLQVDLAFVPAAEFRALAPTFRLVFGDAQKARHVSAPSPEILIGYAWLYAIHARTCIARGKWWQAEHMIGHMRDHALSLACVRRGLPSAHGRGFDQLPDEVKVRFEEALLRGRSAEELLRALRVVMAGLVAEVEAAAPELAERLNPAFQEITSR